MPDLLAGWTTDVHSIAPASDREAAEAAGRDLIARWSEPHRRYHALRHLQEVLDALSEVAGAGELTPEDARRGRLAAWLHDAVYATGAAPGANEAASAELAERVLGQLGVEPGSVACVAGLVRMTADHASAGQDPLAQAFHDADLWILSAPEARFDEYCAQVREEYASVPTPVFGPARAGILNALVGAGGIYRTVHARAAWEQRALDNLRRELDRLT